MPAGEDATPVQLKDRAPPGGWEYVIAGLREIEGELRRQQRARERRAAMSEPKVANTLAYWERVLRMIGEDRPGCGCGYCGPCLARGALAGPAPGECWHEWEALKAVNVERMRLHAGRCGSA